MRSGTSHNAHSPGQSPHRIHVGDICRPKDNENKTGIVFRTHLDTNTHSPDPGDQFPKGIQRHVSIPQGLFDKFFADGIPPARTVLVSWSHDFSEDAEESVTELVPEWTIVAIDRPMFVGDIVRRSADDSMSGTIVSTDVYTSLIEPRPLPDVGDTRVPTLSTARRLHDVPASALQDTIGFTTGQVVVYRSWIGVITDYWEGVCIRLSDGSVVEVEDPEDLENPSFTGEEGATVGDFVTTKKGNLRRGTYIYGSYNPNTPAQGYVVQVAIKEASVKWLQRRLPANDLYPQPPRTLERDELESPDLHIYDRTTLPATSLHSAGIPRISETDVGVGDKVRFRNPEDAKAKYSPDVRLYPRTQTLGYDINVFTVYAVRTMALVQWQDLSTTTHHALELLPSVDLDDGVGVWPGELVFTKKAKHVVPDDDPADDTPYEPEQLGIVQSVNAQDRIARVRWFEGTATFDAENHDQVLRGSWTGHLKGDDNDPQAGEEVSMYDLWTCSSLMRRVGDLVILSTDLIDDPAKLASTGPAPYAEVAGALISPPDDFDWLGEVIELSINGWLVVRLGASKNVRDIRVPWELCVLAAGSDDLDDPALDDDMDDDLDDEDFPTDEDLEELAIGDLVDAFPWTDDLDRPIENVDGHDDWETDEEDNAAEATAMDQSSDGGGEPIEAEAEDQSAPPSEQAATQTPTVPRPASNFSYEDLFADPKLEAFTILDGEPPENHANANLPPPSGNPKLLRRLQKEYNVLRSSLPAGVFVRTWESNLSLLRILILGPLGTPYEYAPFVIDMALDANFPAEPPLAFFHSWTGGAGPVNPNLYEDGKICLSLLGTWPGDHKNATWTPKSTILQVLVSLLGLVLVPEPWYNEAGFEVRAGTAESKTPSALYSERVFLRTRDFIDAAFLTDLGGFESLIMRIYMGPDTGLLRWAVAHAVGVVLRSSGAEPGALDGGAANGTLGRRSVSAGALLSLRRTVAELLSTCKPLPRFPGDESWAQLRRLLEGGPAALRECPADVLDLVRRAG